MTLEPSMLFSVACLYISAFPVSSQSAMTHLLDLSREIAGSRPASSSGTCSFSSHASVVHYSCVSVHTGFSAVLSLSGVEITSLNWKEASNEFPTTLAASANCWQTYLPILSFNVSGALKFSLQSRVSRHFSTSVYLKASAVLSLSGVCMSRLPENSDLLKVLTAPENSIVLREIELTPSLSADLDKSLILSGIEGPPSFSTSNGQNSFDEPGSTGHVSLPADANSAPSMSHSWVLGTALAVGLLLLLLLVSALLLWYHTQHPDRSTDVTDAAEFATDQTDLPELPDTPDGWVEYLHLATDLNALETDATVTDIPFIEPEMLEEGLWLSPRVNRCALSPLISERRADIQ
jgi:hypothetical protein